MLSNVDKNPCSDCGLCARFAPYEDDESSMDYSRCMLGLRIGTHNSRMMDENADNFLPCEMKINGAPMVYWNEAGWEGARSHRYLDGCGPSIKRANRITPVEDRQEIVSKVIKSFVDNDYSASSYYSYDPQRLVAKVKAFYGSELTAVESAFLDSYEEHEVERHLLENMKYSNDRNPVMAHAMFEAFKRKQMA